MFEFESLKPEKAEMPKSYAPRIGKDNPFIPWVRETFETKEALAVTIPNEEYERATRMVRRAAEYLGIGIRIACSMSKQERAKAAKDRKVKLFFQGVEKRKYNKTGKHAKTTKAENPENPVKPDPAKAGNAKTTNVKA